MRKAEKNNSSSENRIRTFKMNDFGKNKSSVIAGSILAVIIFACVFCRFFMTKDPTYMDLENCNISPNKEFFFGTDTMGRDIFSMIPICESSDISIFQKRIDSATSLCLYYLHKAMALWIWSKVPFLISG